MTLTPRASSWTPAPEYVFPATVSFVAPESQFTPKTVEVQSEREQLVLSREVAEAASGVLKGMEDRIKVGLARSGAM